MVSLTLLLTLASAAAASPTRVLAPRQAECQAVRNAIVANSWPCSEMTSPTCGFCCESWLDLSDAFGDPPCHEDHGDFSCPSGNDGWHCVAHVAK